MAEKVKRQFLTLKKGQQRITPLQVSKAVSDFQQRGDIRAFKLIHNRYYPYVKSIVYDFYKDYCTVDELCQLIFIKVFHKIGTYDSEKSKFQTWLYTVAYNYTIDYWRSENSKTRPDVSLWEKSHFENSDFLDTDHELKVDGSFDEDDQELQKRIDALMIAISELDETKRRVLLDRVIGGLSYQQIQDRYEIKDHTVKNYIFNSKKSLRQQLEHTL